MVRHSTGNNSSALHVSAQEERKSNGGVFRRKPSDMNVWLGGFMYDCVIHLFCPFSSSLLLMTGNLKTRGVQIHQGDVQHQATKQCVKYYMLREEHWVRDEETAAERHDCRANSQWHQNPGWETHCLITHFKSHVCTGTGSYRNIKELMLVLRNSLKLVGVLLLWTPTSLIKESLTLLERMVFAPNQSLNNINWFNLVLN